ncbi:MAG: transporter [Gemmatimonadetes bacterium]|nr:transporter [Gemmatimonadota bacterium]
MKYSNQKNNLGRNLGMWAVVLGALYLPVSASGQEEHEDDGHSHGLHFSHPLFSESITPDTKVRFDFGREWEAEGTTSELEIEAEYAFHPAFSIEFVAPYSFVSPDVGPEESGFGNVALALKFANFAFEDKGLLLGYGLEVVMPTGDDAKGIGSGHIWEIEPFLGIGLMTGNLELTSRTRFGIPINQNPGEEVETELHYDFSALYHFSPRVQGLLELNGETGLSGDEAGEGIVSLSPGIKVAPFAAHPLFVGLGGSFPLGDEELNARLKLALFYHF